MSDQEKQESQKTVVSFIAGLLIGGLLVWVFGGTPKQSAPTAVTNVDTGTTTTMATGTAANTTTNQPSTATTATSSAAANMQMGNGSITVEDQPAGMSVQLHGAIFPVKEGWIAVRSYENGQLGRILGAALFSQTQKIVPDTISLLAPTVAGQQYAVVFFSDDGSHTFNLAHDKQIGSTLATFTAQ